MSYPSINRHLDAQGATIYSATDAEMQLAFMAAFREDLPLGIQHVEALVGKVAANKGRAMIDLDPNSAEGRQVARLLGADIARSVLENHYGLAFGFYNCCKPVAAPTRDALKLTYREQIAAQDPAFVNC